MAIKLLMISGYGMRRQSWAHEAAHVRQHVDWIEEVIVSTGNPLGPYEQRASQIMAEIGDRLQPADRLIIIAHSFGGVVARYLASRRLLDPAAIVTIATPHYGVQHVDLYQQVVQQLPMLGPLVKGGYTVLTRLYGTNPRALDQLTTEAMATFNDDHPDRPDVVYQSYGCVAEKVSWWLRLAFALLTAYSKLPNDGLIALPSTHWGTYMDTVICDHNEAVGWSGPNHFDSAQFVVDILDRLPEAVKNNPLEATQTIVTDQSN